MKEWAERHQVLAVAAAGGFAFIFWELRSIAVVVFAGFTLAAALRPAVDWVSARSIPRVVAILIVYVALFGILVAILVPAALPLAEQAGKFTSDFSSLLSSLLGPGSFFGQFGVSVEDLKTFLSRQTLPLAASAFFFLADAVSVLIISIYLLYDWHERHRAMAAHESRAWRTLLDTLRDVEHTLGAWVRGQLLLSGIVGLMVFLSLIGLGIDFAPVLGVIAALFEFIPYAGPILAAIPAVLFALHVSTTQALIVALVYLIIQQIENHLLVPLIMKNVVNLHPVLVITALLTGYEVAGIVGALFAVPMTAVLVITVEHATLHYRTS